MAITNVTRIKHFEKRIKRKHKDAYKNIKVWVSIDEWKKIRKLSKLEDKTVCDTVEMLIVNGFSSKYFKDYPTPAYAAKDNGEFVNTWLPAADHSTLYDLAIEWGLSIRKTAYKLLFHELDKYKDLGGYEDEPTHSEDWRV